MSLTTELSKRIPNLIQQRGIPYYREGAVRIVHGDADVVSANVSGIDVYQVTLTRRKSAIKAYCSCPYFADHMETCKHIWATLLAAEAQGYLRAHEAKRSMRIEPDWDMSENASDDEEWIDYFHEDWDGEPKSGPIRFPGNRKQRKTKKTAPIDQWKQHFSQLNAALLERKNTWQPWPSARQFLYVVDVPGTLAGNGLIVEVAYQERKATGEWSKPKSQRMDFNQISTLPDPADRRIQSLLAGAKDQNDYYSGSYYGSYGFSTASRYVVTQAMQDAVLPFMCATNRCLVRPGQAGTDLHSLRWDDGLPWEFAVSVVPDESGNHFVLSGGLVRDSERMGLAAPLMLVAGGLVFWGDKVSRLNDHGGFQWISWLRQQGSVTIPIKERDHLLEQLMKLPMLPRLELPEELRYEETRPQPRPRLRIQADNKPYGQKQLLGTLSFDYDGLEIAHDEIKRGIYQADRHRLVLRDPGAELAAADQLRQLGFRTSVHGGRVDEDFILSPKHLPKVVRTVTAAGWHVEADGKLFRQPGTFSIEVRSGIDWFELDATVQFGDTQAKLPELLAALRRGDNSVRLDDGTYGMLPEAWLKKYGLLAGLGTTEDGQLRFTKSQVGLLDALLAAQPEVQVDAGFTRARDELQRFAGIEPADPPAEFVGELRGYQREGLGWLHFLQKFGFGGCLADDMGLGKTVQVLGLLESRRQLRMNTKDDGTDRPRPSLVVVPRSLVFNWIQEAARFTPQLRVLDHTGMGREKIAEHFDQYDLVVTTYGTLRNDILLFKDVAFDYCVLDEAQAIKNANSESAKAGRLLKGNHRLVLSGTPVQNHLGELWSLFEFLNPGMLGSASVFRLAGGAGRNPEPEMRDLLARALRPFILRRTKEQVARDLPEKLEQTVYCELEPAQRKQYEELREHYRQSLLARIKTTGINKAKIQILEALLRLRQAACHPGLIDKSKVGESSAKLDFLIPQIEEVLDEGHKILVFSQFTSLLAIVRDRLDRDKIPYEYLDGRTRDRQSRVERFQNDPNCKLFLISLKAGGLGLNLTAAEYVYLLDPWWNPAVEAQAIDRAHRIGQTQRVFAYRLIARNTIEEKVLELQKTKRALADSILNADNSLIGNLSREDLELLLG
jgi:hypothetical protein